MRCTRLIPALVLSLMVHQSAAAQEIAPAPAPVVRLSGYLQARETWQENAGLTGSINRARLAASGVVATDFSWKLQGEFRTGNVGNGKASVSLVDAYIRWSHRQLGLQVGQFKTPFTWEYMTALPDLETADRATAVDSLAPKRDIGVMGDYRFAGVARVYAGVFNGEGTNVTFNKDSSALGVGRLEIRPISTIEVGAGVARYFGDSTRYSFDANYAGPRFIVRGEYVAQARDSLGGSKDHGWFALGAVKTVPQLQLVFKYEDFRRDQISLQQRDRAWTAGANAFLHGEAVRLSMEYVSRKIGDPGVRTGVLLTQLQLRY
ncbi:MAG TPA: porin [Gemmatimonadales bacterium]|nr:porin [Gemmatimonadales bacterium]